MLDKSKIFNKIQRIPLIVPFLVLILCCIGFITLYSASGGHLAPWATKQIMVFFIIMPVAFFIILMDIRIIYNFSYLFYFINILLLVLVLVIGKKAMGATRWIDLYFFTIQPSEFTKIATVFFLARYLHENSSATKTELKDFFIPFFIVIIPFLLIIKQPDLGNAIILLFSCLAIFFVFGVQIRYFVISFIVGICCLPIIWLNLHNYQRSRVLTFLDPQRDPLGAGYNIIQSKIAIGSGGLFGKGFLQSTQSGLNFLPEHQTDFIFALFAEEFGFFISMILLLLYFLLAFFSFVIAIDCRNVFLKLIVVGITSIFFGHVIMNIGMVIGLLPVVGKPLPFLSYGGTMLGALLIGFSFIINAGINKNIKF